MKKTILIILVMCVSVSFALSDENIRDTYRKSYNYEKIENYSNAIKALMPVYQAYGNTYTVNLRLGWLYYLKKNYANSMEHYNKAVQIAPASLEAQSSRLLTLLAQERYAEAEQWAFAILKVDHYNFYGNIRLAYSLRMQKKLKAAEQINLKMLAIYPLDVTFLSEYALVKHAQGDIAAAVKAFHSVLILDPENVTAKAYLREK
ncbi:MAG: tetratricopeptide repeat protein [Phycisphaeraceae bacterium]|nr:tetratricopeptide repeat protein [Phycisphaeraceae bacterium]